MCGGIPFMIASVAKILRKSWGVKARGWPAASVMPVPASALVIQLADRRGAEGPAVGADAVLEQQRASAGSDSRSWMS